MRLSYYHQKVNYYCYSKLVVCQLNCFLLREDALFKPLPMRGGTCGLTY